MIDLVRHYLGEDIEVDPVLDQKLNDLCDKVSITKGQKSCSNRLI